MRPDYSTGNQKVPSVYRKIEMLSVLFVDISSKAPKICGVRQKLVRILDELDEALVGTILAYDDPDTEAKYKLTLNIGHHLKMVSGLSKVLFEWSNSNTKGIHVFSKSDHANYLTMYQAIWTELTRWNASIKSNLVREQRAAQSGLNTKGQP